METKNNELKQKNFAHLRAIIITIRTNRSGWLVL